MHIGINAQLLSFSQNYRNGGISRYIRSLLTALAEWLEAQASSHEVSIRAPLRSAEGSYASNYQFTVFVNGQDVVEQLAARHPQISYVPVSWPESRPASRVAWEQLTLPLLLRKRHIDVLHSPANVLPELLPRNCVGVVTLHDLAFLRFPHVLTRAKQLYHRTFTIRSLQRATMIISVSESTRQDAIELVGVPTERVQTVYPCIAERFSNVIREKELVAFRQQQGLTQGFLLYLGTLEPRKNLITLIEAYARLRSEHATAEKLVIAGGRGWLYDAILEKVQTLGLSSEVIFPGFVADEEQALWYHAASAFVYPSLYEGFGFPVAEALACGTPVVTSNVSSLPEAGANIALIIDPDNVEALAQAMYKALTDQAFRQRCQAMGPVVAQRFSAQAMVEQTLSVYEQAATMHFSQARSRRISFV
jgi:glycosyltransferase involved in cell wall biosynthesis